MKKLHIISVISLLLALVAMIWQTVLLTNRLKFIEHTLFGTYAQLQHGDYRTQSWYYPAADSESESLSLSFRGDDGLVYYLLKKIEKVEPKKELENVELKITK